MKPLTPLNMKFFFKSYFIMVRQGVLWGALEATYVDVNNMLLTTIFKHRPYKLWCSPRVYFRSFSFLICINDLSKVCSYTTPIILAGDTNILLSGLNVKQMQTTINKRIVKYIKLVAKSLKVFPECKKNLGIYQKEIYWYWYNYISRW